MEGSKEDLEIENKKFKYLGYTERSSGSRSYRSRTIYSRSWITDIPTRESLEFSTLTGFSDASEEDGLSVVSDELFDSEVDDQQSLLSKNKSLTRGSNSGNQKQEEISSCSKDTFFDHPSIPSLERSGLKNYTKKRTKNDILWKEKVKNFLGKDLPKSCFQKSKVSCYYKMFLKNLY